MGEHIMKIAIYPGSFDPITNGHIDIIKRASTLFDELIIGVTDDNNKESMFDIHERVAMIEGIVKDYDNVNVQTFNGLLIDFAKLKSAVVIIRGLRVLSDFEYEFKLAMMNRGLSQKVDTLFLMPSIQYVHISSSLIKEVAILGGDISTYVPRNILDKIKRKISVKK